MELTSTPSRIHPLMAGAAVSVTLVSLLGVAALSGLLPTSHGSVAPLAETTPATVATTQNGFASSAVTTPSNALMAAPIAAPVTASTAASAPVLVKTASGYQYMRPVTGTTPAATPAYQVASEPAPVYHNAPTHHVRHHYTNTYAQADTGYRSEVRPSYSQQPVYAAPARANSPVGIATGAVVGGLLGSQIGGGNGRTLATVAGAVGGGYLGNMAGQRYGY